MSLNLVSIKPSPLSNSFRSSLNGVEQVDETVTKDGKEYRVSKNWDEKRFPNSVQKERTIIYSSLNKKWMLDRFDENCEDLNTYVKQCAFLNTKRNHPDYGKLITSCDIRDSNDPFFIHSNLYVRLIEGYGNLNLKDPKDLLLYLGAKKNHRFDVGGDDNAYAQRRAKYIMVDKNLDKQAKEVVMNNTLEATKLFENMSEEKMKMVALAMGITRDLTISGDVVKSVLFEYVIDNKTKVVGSQMSKQEFFLEMAKTDVDQLSIRNSVQLGFAKGTIKRDKDSGWVAFGIPVGRDKQAVTNYYLNPANNDALTRLEQANDVK